MDFGKEEWDGHDCYPRHGPPSLSNFHADLVFEEFRVVESCFVEDEHIGEGGDCEVDCCTCEPVSKY